MRVSVGLLFSSILISIADSACAPQRHTGCAEKFMCYVEHLWFMDGKFYADGPTETIDVGHSVQMTIHSLRYAQRPVHALESWKGVLSVIRHRIYPNNFAHMLRDSISHDLYAFRRFHTKTWDLQTVRQNLRMLYLDGKTTSHPGYRMHSAFPPWEKSTHELPNNLYFEHAVLGDGGVLPPCNMRLPVHFFSPVDWHHFAEFIARATLGNLPARKPSLVWLANRDRGESRQMPGGEALAVELNRMGFNVVSTRPSELRDWHEQVKLARQASVLIGPHGSNMANMILMGNATGVLEFLSHELLSGWYAQQSVYQGVRWFSYPNSYAAVKGPPLMISNVSEVAMVLRQILDGRYTPRCTQDFFHTYQICS